MPFASRDLIRELAAQSRKNQSLFTVVRAMSPSVPPSLVPVPYFVLEFKTREEIVAASEPQTWDATRIHWYKAVREKNLRAMKALLTLSRDPAYASSPQVDFSDFLGYALTHVQDDECFLERIYRDFGKNRQRRVSHSKLQTIIKDGPLRTIRWMHGHNLRFTTAAVNRAAVFGRLDIVEFLHESRTEGCTAKAMDGAARDGHLDVIKFLHENRHEECTSSAMVIASSGGHLEVLRFLHENRSEERAAHAMWSAVEGGYLSCIKYLHDQKVRSVTTDACLRVKVEVGLWQASN